MHILGSLPAPRMYWPLQCRVELAKVDVLVVPTSAYNYTVQEILVRGEAHRARPCDWVPSAGCAAREACHAAGRPACWPCRHVSAPSSLARLHTLSV